MIWLLAAAGCSITIATIIKINTTRGGDRLVLIGANYIVASLFALILLKGNIPRPGVATLTLGSLAGIDYVFGFLLLIVGISRGPLAVPVTVMRLSVVVPIVVSIFLWNESPAAIQWAGIALGFVAVVLFGAGLRNGGDASAAGGNADEGWGGYWTFVVSLFLVMGLGDVLLKACRELSPSAERLLFTWILFTVAALFAWIIIIVRRVPIRRNTMLLGFVLGVPNLFSTIFTLRGLEAVPASIAFPFVNLTVILGTTLFGFVIWKEKLRPLHILGLLVAAGALILLPLG